MPYRNGRDGRGGGRDTVCSQITYGNSGVADMLRECFT